MNRKEFLIAVDLQNDFVNGSLGTAEAQSIVTVAANRIRTCRENGGTVICTLDTHEENYLETAEGKKLPVRHCIRGSEGWKLNQAVQKAAEGCVMLEKPTFGSIRLPELIRNLTGPEDELSIELIGLCTDICVVSNALLLKANFPEARIAVRPECCAGVTPEKHRAALETMASCQIEIL